MGRTAAGKALASAKTVCASVKTAVFTHRSFARIRVSAKEQQELAMCWRWDRVSKMHGSAIVIDTRTEGSKGLGHSSHAFVCVFLCLAVGKEDMPASDERTVQFNGAVSTEA